jgi:hypothetical protein
MGLLSGTQKPVREGFQWDVFLSYRHPDRDSVEYIATKLSEMDLKVWWDEWEVAPGEDFQQKLWDGLTRSWATAVFIGPKTLGGWQEKEVKAAIEKQVKSGKPVIPVFLPNVPDPDKIEIEFLGLNSRVVFERALTEDRVYKIIGGLLESTRIARSRPSRQRRNRCLRTRGLPTRVSRGSVIGCDRQMSHSSWEREPPEEDLCTRRETGRSPVTCCAR